MKTRLCIAGIGNLIDCIVTFIFTQYFGVPELNPFMAWLLQWPIFAMVFKMVVVTSVLVYAWRSEHNKYTEGLATFAAVLYGAVGLYYIVSIFALIF